MGVRYHCLVGEAEEDDFSSSDFYFAGEVELEFAGAPSLFLTWAENAGWNDHFSLQVRKTTAFVPGAVRPFDAASMEMWQRHLQARVVSMAIVGWDETPHVLRIDFETGSVLVGTGCRDEFGEGDDMLSREYDPALLPGSEVLWEAH